MRRLLLLLALCGCKSKEPAKQAPPADKQQVALDAAPIPPSVLQLAAVDEAVTAPLHTAALVIVKQDGALSIAPQEDLSAGALDVATMAQAEPAELAVIGARTDELTNARMGRELDKLAQDAGTDPCGVNGGFGFGRSGLGPGGGSGDGTIGLGGYGTVGHGYGGAMRTRAGLRGAPITTTTYCDVWPLVLVDARAPAARLVEVLEALPHAAIGVTTDGGAHARTLAITFSFLKGNTAVDASVLELGFVVGPTAISGAGYRGAAADATLWSWTGDAAGLADAYHQGQAKDGLTGGYVRLRLDGAATAGALIAAIANLLAGHVEGVALGEPTDYLAASSGGSSSKQAVVLIGQATITGEYDKAIFRRYVKRNQGKLRYCYEQRLATAPKLEGDLTATWTIQPDGKVKDANVVGLDDALATCMLKYLEGIEYPKPTKGAVTIVQPLTVRPPGA